MKPCVCDTHVLDVKRFCWVLEIELALKKPEDSKESGGNTTSLMNFKISLLSRYKWKLTWVIAKLIFKNDITKDKACYLTKSIFHLFTGNALPYFSYQSKSKRTRLLCEKESLEHFEEIHSVFEYIQYSLLWKTTFKIF